MLLFVQPKLRPLTLPEPGSGCLGRAPRRGEPPILVICLSYDAPVTLRQVLGVCVASSNLRKCMYVAKCFTQLQLHPLVGELVPPVHASKRSSGGRKGILT